MIKNEFISGRKVYEFVSAEKEIVFDSEERMNEFFSEKAGFNVFTSPVKTEKFISNREL